MLADLALPELEGMRDDGLDPARRAAATNALRKLAQTAAGMAVVAEIDLETFDSISGLADFVDRMTVH